jgi:hypothetical protein
MIETVGSARALPTRMHLKNGSYYYVYKDKDRKGHWIKLARTFEEAFLKYRELYEKAERGDLVVSAPTNNISYHIKYLHDRCRASAKERDILFTLKREDILNMGESNYWRCAVTDIRFDFSTSARDTHQRPWYPSIDRIDCKKGYTTDNCRMVCVAANLAMNEFGEKALTRLAIAYITKHPELIPMTVGRGLVSLREK